jgi:hypothetical protein
MALRIDVQGGVLLLVVAPYAKATVDCIRALPERHYRPQTQDWCVPARRENLRNVCALIGELEQLSTEVHVSDAARARLARVDVGRAVVRGTVIEIAGAYSPRRVPALRALPERRFDADRGIWTIPLTRAGALAILDLADRSGELVATQRARRALQRAATQTASAAARDPSAQAPARTRRSPIAHWRHYTAGPVFDNPAHERVNVPGIGRCVRIRVTPHGPRGDGP